MGYRDALLRHYQTMLRGIRCNIVNLSGPLISIGVHDTCYEACADVYTGIAQSFDCATPRVWKVTGKAWPA